MSKGKNNTAAVSVAVLKSNLEAAETALNLITETSTVEQIKIAQTAFDEAQTDLEALTEDSTTDEKEAAQTAFDEAKKVFEAVLELPTLGDKAVCQTAFDEAKKAYEGATAPKTTTAPKAEKAKLLKGKFILSPTGMFGLGYNVGEEAELPELQAKELDEAGYFEIEK